MRGYLKVAENTRLTHQSLLNTEKLDMQNLKTQTGIVEQLKQSEFKRTYKSY